MPFFKKQYNTLFHDIKNDNNYTIEVLKFIQNIDNCGALLSKEQMLASTHLIKILNLFPHIDNQKNWDTIKSLFYIVTRVDNNGPILDGGADISSPVLNSLAQLGYSNLHACDVVFYDKKKNNPKINYSIQSLEKTNFQDRYFKAITVLSVIEHGLNIHAFFKEMNRIADDDCLMIITTDYWPEPIDCSGLRFFNSDVKIFTKKDILELCKIAESHGFYLVKPIDFNVEEKCVRWDAIDREYTFLFAAFLKKNI